MTTQVNTDDFRIELNLSAAQVNVILGALGAQPHDTVRSTIDEVLGQAKPQYEYQLEQAIAANQDEPVAE